MKGYLVFILIVQTFSSGEKLEKDSSNVYVLNEINIESVIKTLDSVLVAFYSPRCKSCRDLETLLPAIGKLVLGRSIGSI